MTTYSNDHISVGTLTLRNANRNGHEPNNVHSGTMKIVKKSHIRESPAAAAPPVRVAPYYLFTKVLGLSGNIEESQAPPPPAGAGLAQGGDNLKKNDFSRAKKSVMIYLISPE